MSHFIYYTYKYILKLYFKLFLLFNMSIISKIFWILVINSCNLFSDIFSAAGIQNINVYSLHPGVVKTELSRYLDASYFRGARLISSLINPLMKTAEQGAQTTIYCAIDENAGKESGLYYE